MQSTLKKTYHTASHPAGYGGLKKLEEATGATQSQIREFAETEDLYQKFKPARKKFPRAEMKFEPYNVLWAADTVFMKALAPYNNNKSYWLVVIETLSRQLSIELLETLKGVDVAKGFLKIIKKRKKPCQVLFTDFGSEFYSKPFRDLCRHYRIRLYSTGSETKSFLVERINRTILQKLWPLLAKKNTWSYINLLDKIVQSYNNSKHRSLGVSPNSINDSNYIPILNKRFRKQAKKPKFKKSQKVRVAYQKKTFSKGYSQSYSNRSCG